jgi:hypothetical protein
VDFDWIQPWNVIASILLSFVGTGIKRGWFTSFRRGLGDRIRWEQTNAAKDLRIASLEAELEDLTKDIEARAARAKRVASAIGYEDSSPTPTTTIKLEKSIEESSEPSLTSTTSTAS